MWNAADAERGIARLNRATHARAIGTFLRTQFLAEDLFSSIRTSMYSILSTAVAPNMSMHITAVHVLKVS